MSKYSIYYRWSNFLMHKFTKKSIEFCNLYNVLNIFKTDPHLFR